MSAHCCPPSETPVVDPRVRRALWIALVLNAAMFAIELGASWSSGSVALLADSIDFFGDAANYALSLAVLAMSVRARAGAAFAKAACMAGFGLFVLGRAGSVWLAGSAPEPATMGAVGFAALLVNAGVAVMLYRFRAGDANLRSVWLCSRNDALGNAAVMLAALGVFGTGGAWPDLLVAGVIAALALSGAWSVARQARGEWRGEWRGVAAPAGACAHPPAASPHAGVPPAVAEVRVSLPRPGSRGSDGARAPRNAA